MKISLMICKHTKCSLLPKIDYLVPTCIHLNNWGLICVNYVACTLYPIWEWIVQICWKWVTMICAVGVFGMFTSCNWLQVFKYSASCANLLNFILHLISCHHHAFIWEWRNYTWIWCYTKFENFNFLSTAIRANFLI